MTVVEFDNLADFISELREEFTRIADRTVRWKCSKTPEQAENISFEIDVWATALRKGGDEDLLFEFGTPCGCDDAKGPAGTKAADEMKAKLSEACDDLGLQLRPGKIEPY